MSTCVDQAWLDLHPEALIPVIRTKPDRAHPYAPGTGPAGQSCGTCQKCVYREGYRKRFYKCHVLKATWTAGKGTDIRLRDSACKSWEPAIDKIELVSTLARGVH